jgi:hypothetical protein
MVTAKEHVERLAKYKYCLCPEGNGVDTHRLWEALLLGSVPIVKNTAFTRVIQHYTRGEIPMIVMDSWWDSVKGKGGNCVSSESEGARPFAKGTLFPTGASAKGTEANGLWLSMEYYTQLIIKIKGS